MIWGERLKRNIQLALAEKPTYSRREVMEIVDKAWERTFREMAALAIEKLVHKESEN